MDFKLTFLGTGTSVGIPMVGCSCPGCTSKDPRDKRYRSSVLLEWGSRVVVVDTGPEFRLQMLRAGVKRLDAVFITHNHADHVLGLDDVRPYCFLQDMTMPVYGDRRTLDWIRNQMFSYVWEPVQKGGGLPRLELRVVDDEFDLFGLNVKPLPVIHGKLPIYGYRFGNVAYVSDVSEIPVDTMKMLDGVDTVILDAVRYEPHTTHFNVDKAVEAGMAIGARQTLFTHLNHDILHEKLSSELPEGFSVAFDGLEIAGKS